MQATHMYAVRTDFSGCDAILLLVLFYAIPRFILICGIRVLSSFAESAYGIRFRNPLPRFILTP